MNEMDRAQEINEQHVADSLAVVLRRLKPTLRGIVTHCIDCRELIPEARRQAMVGCIRCIDCQELFEAGGCDGMA